MFESTNTFIAYYNDSQSHYIWYDSNFKDEDRLDVRPLVDGRVATRWVVNGSLGCAKMFNSKYPGLLTCS